MYYGLRRKFDRKSWTNNNSCWCAHLFVVLLIERIACFFRSEGRMDRKSFYAELNFIDSSYVRSICRGPQSLLVASPKREDYSLVQKTIVTSSVHGVLSGNLNITICLHISKKSHFLGPPPIKPRDVTKSHWHNSQKRHTRLTHTHILYPVNASSLPSLRARPTTFSQTHFRMSQAYWSSQFPNSPLPHWDPLRFVSLPLSGLHLPPPIHPSFSNLTPTVKLMALAKGS